MQTHPSSLSPRQPGPALARTMRPALAAAALLALLPWPAGAAPQPPTPTELMDWAQAHLPAYFPGTLADVRGEGFVFRGPYSTGHFLGVADGKAYAMGPATGGQMLALGTLQELACVVKPASCAPSDALALANDYLGRVSALHAAEITSGAALGPLLDGCYLSSGRNRAAEMARLDTDPAALASTNRKRGSTRRAAEVLSERFAINPDGSDRREIDVRYELVYADGVVDTVRETLIQGSSAGTRSALGVCSTPQTGQQLRLLGNQKIVGTSVTALNMVLDRYRLADGAPQASAARLYRNEVRFNITDPGNVATYATISGPGIVGSAYKMVSPRLLRSAPEFTGKVGNFVDLEDSDTFKACRNASDNNYADAATADCTANGATSNYSRAQGTDGTQVDRSFAGYGFVAGGRYTIKVYADDGWKTVNGQAGKTPLATYTAVLASLPASAAALAGGSAGQYGTLGLSRSPTELAALVRGRGQAALQFSESAKARVEGATLPFTTAYYFAQGRTAASTSSNYYPASRYNPSTSPAVGAATVSLDIPPAPAAMTQPSYAEFGGTWDTLTGLYVRHLVTFE